MRALVAVCALLVSCSTTRPEAVPLGPAEVRATKAAADALAVGRSTKADVRAALGEAVVVDFATGYEVWVYKERPRGKAPAPTELVLLFDRSGILTKTRIR